MCISMLLKKCWVEHFKETLNQPEPPELFTLEEEEQSAQVLNIDIEYIKEAEMIRAIKKLKNNKAAGMDEIQAEILKNGGETMIQKLTNLCNLCWVEEAVPEDWRK